MDGPLAPAIALLALAIAGLALALPFVGSTPKERELENRILQLEVHDCGLTQFEDYSVVFQQNDVTRIRCVETVRGVRP